MKFYRLLAYWWGYVKSYSMMAYYKGKNDGRIDFEKTKKVEENV